jgi:hypothetical protein
VDLVLLETIRDSAPARLDRYKFPPDEKTKGWLNEVLDARLKATVQTALTWMDSENERAISSADRAPHKPGWWGWQLLIINATEGNPTTSRQRTVRPLRREVRLAQERGEDIDQDALDYLASRDEKGRGARPHETLGRKLARGVKWLAELDALHLEEVLPDIYDDLARRAPDDTSPEDEAVITIQKLAKKLAAERWRLTDRELGQYMALGKNDPRRLLLKGQPLETALTNSWISHRGLETLVIKGPV